MSWKIRHEGSPRSIEVPTAEQVVQGLQDGQWEVTDEVMGDRDTNWVAIESHPQFAEVVLDMEPPPPKEHDDETRLDMTPLIDVCLVLLIFFILTTSYAALQKMLEASGLTTDSQGVTHVHQEAKIQMIAVTVKKQQGGEWVIEVEGQAVPKEALQGVLQAFGGKGKRPEVLLDHDPKVPHGLIVRILDDAKKAGITNVHTVIPQSELR